MNKYENLLEIRAAKINYIPFHLCGHLRLIYVLKGSIDCRWVAGTHNLSAGQIEIVNINEPFCVERGSEDNLVLFFELCGEKAVSCNAAIDDALYNCNTTLFYDSKTDAHDQNILKSKLQTLYQDYLQQEETSLIEERVCDIVDFIVENCHDLLNMLNAKKGSDPRADRFLRIYTYIYNHCNEKINLKQLAEREYVSQQYLSKEFNERLNMNFKDTLEYYRVIQAVRYLITTNKTVTMISELCGFSAPRYFYKHFSLYLKCMPVEFRTRYLSKTEQVMWLKADDPYFSELLKKTDMTEENPDNTDEEEPQSILYTPADVKYNRRKVSKELIGTLTEFVRQRLPEQVEVMELPAYGTRNRMYSYLQQSREGICSEGTIPPVMLVFYTREKRDSKEEGHLAMKAGQTGVSAYMMCQMAELQGLCSRMDFQALCCGAEIRKILGADEALCPLLVVSMGYLA